ncbi:hypothetical protein BDD12DRAFT_904646 [Trichophaea hybrida]|nr:hypothetical protein BDD12DRAFT_904646 [Trichophaea hybrida]
MHPTAACFCQDGPRPITFCHDVLVWLHDASQRQQRSAADTVYGCLFSFRNPRDPLSLSDRSKNPKRCVRVFFRKDPPPPPSDSAILRRLDRYEEKLKKFDKHVERFDLFETRVKQNYDRLKSCFLQLQDNFFKKLENDNEATTTLQENDKSLRERIASDKFFCQETRKISCSD